MLTWYVRMISPILYAHEVIVVSKVDWTTAIQNLARRMVQAIKNEE